MNTLTAKISNYNMSQLQGSQKKMTPVFLWIFLKQ